MYPNPADVLPLPARPNLEQYKKRAKALVKACTSGERDMIRRWAADWIESLACALSTGDSDRRAWFDRRVNQVEDFAWKKLSASNRRSDTCTLGQAQFVLARVHGFQSWPQFATHQRAHSHDLALVAVRIGGRGHHHRRRGCSEAPPPCKSGADTRAVPARPSSDSSAVRRGQRRRELSSEDA